MNESTRALPFVAAMVAGLLLFAVHLPAATADTAPTDPSNPATPTTVAAQALPTAQVNGVVWSQVIIGNTVYAAGNFTSVRPAGSPRGANETARANLVAYNITTGAFSTSWAPKTDGQVRTITKSPDGSRLYIGGDFTKVNGTTRYRVAALSPSSGSLIAWAPRPNGYVRSLVATNDTVFIGGHFSAIDASARTRIGSVSASSGAVLPFAPRLEYGNGNGYVWAMAISPDASKVAFGGSFVSVNGSSNPGYGMAMVSSTSGALQGMPANNVIRNGGADAAMTGMASDSDSLYVTGYDFGSGGNFEGTSRISWNSGQITWVEDCHGDTYGVFPSGGVIYKVSHAHYCGNLPSGGFQQTAPAWTFHFAQAYSKAVQGTLGRDLEGYANFEGQPAPGGLPWAPKLEQGAFTGQNQAAWTITGNSDYVLLGGEFPRAGVTVGGSMATQQGLARYATAAVTGPNNKIGPELKGSETNPRLSTVVSGSVRVSWQANWDRDNENLTYEIYRNGGSSPAYTSPAIASTEGYRPQLGWTDTGRTPGATYTYRLVAIDPFNNKQASDTITITVPGSGRTQGVYASKVLDDGASLFWRLGDPSGSTAVDWAGTRNAVIGSGVSRNTAGAIVGDNDAASTFSGTTSGTLVASTGAADQPAELATNTFTQEAWIKTSSTRGGEILSFGNSRVGASSTYDRVLYVTNNGRIAFGVNAGAQRTIASTASFNDNQWHHVVATLGADGMKLYVDGSKIAQRSDETRGDSYYGYWRVGGDNLSGWPNRPTSNHLAAVFDDVAIYPVVLSGAKVAAHNTLGRDPGSVPNAAPVASFSASTNGLAASFDSSASADPDGSIVSRAWDFGDGGTSAASSPSRTYASSGTYPVRLTITDDDGATNSATQSVSVSTPPPAGVLAADGFGRSVVNGLGNADMGGTWTLGGTSSSFSVSDGVGSLAMASPGSGPKASLNSVSSSAVDVSIRYGLDKIPNGGGMFFSLGGRVVGTNDYRAKVKIGPDGEQVLYLVRVLANSETTLGSVGLAGVKYSIGSQMHLRLQVAGTSPTTLRVKAWKASSTEPSAWTLTRTDSSTGLQVAGGLSVATYLSGTATNGPVIARIDDLSAVSAN